MAKKTKKQKIIAHLRRQVLLNQTATTTHTSPSHPLNTTVSFTIPTSKKSPTPAAIPVITPTFLYRDLTKTGIVAAVLFAIQFFLYWVFERGGDKVLAPLLMKLSSAVLADLYK